MKKFKLKKEQLNEYIDRKKAEIVFGSILDGMHNNSKYLKENISVTKANRKLIESFNNNGIISPKVMKLLKEHGIVNDNELIIE